MNNYSEAAADRAVSFFNRLLVHTKGRWAGVPFQLRPWQEHDIIRPLFGALNPDGMRTVRTFYGEVPRKNGKSEIAAGVALYLLLADGEEGAEVYGAAADRDQASIVFNVAAEMVRRSPALSKRCKIIDSQKRIVVPKTGSFYRAIPADAAGSHGFNASGIVFDELHAQPNRELWDVLTTSTGARTQPLVFAITTAGYDRESVCYEQHDYAVKVLNRVVDDPTFLAYIRAAEEQADWTDEAVWLGCNPALGDFRGVDEMRAMARRAMQTPGLQNTFRRLYLNQWTSQEARWLDLAAWDATAGIVRPAELEGRECYAGLDLASTTDVAALVLAFPLDNGEIAVLPYFWVPRQNLHDKGIQDRAPYEAWASEGLLTATEGNVIDYGSIKDTLLRLGERYHINEIAYDRWGAVQLSQELDGAGFTVVPMGQGFASMSPPTKELLNLVLSQRLRHGGNRVLRWMADNMMVVQDAAGNVKPTKSADRGKSRKRIDGMVALIMAIDRLTRHDHGASVYEERGMLVL